MLFEDGGSCGSKATFSQVAMAPPWILGSWKWKIQHAKANGIRESSNCIDFMVPHLLLESPGTSWPRKVFTKIQNQNNCPQPPPAVPNHSSPTLSWWCDFLRHDEVGEEETELTKRDSSPCPVRSHPFFEYCIQATARLIWTFTRFQKPQFIGRWQHAFFTSLTLKLSPYL